MVGEALLCQLLVAAQRGSMPAAGWWGSVATAGGGAKVLWDHLALLHTIPIEHAEQHSCMLTKSGMRKLSNMTVGTSGSAAPRP